MTLVAETVAAGARRSVAVAQLGLQVRTLQRWAHAEGEGDRRRGPHTAPAHRLSADERAQVLALVNSPPYRDLSPQQIVPRLLDERGLYLASESTLYRLLRQADQLTHRQRSRPAVARPRAHLATGPNQVMSWDITWLPGPIRGTFFYLYLSEDIWSRQIVGAEVHPEESSALAAALFQRTCDRLELDPAGLILPADNGGPMKGSTMLATLQRLGVVASFSRPNVSDDNPYSEALFRTMKYRPHYPSGPFASLIAARAWVAGFVTWYNTEHRHSAIRFVTPAQRHQGQDIALLERRHQLYQQARARRPQRWSRQTRNWSPVRTVSLNPDRKADPVAAG